MPAAAHSRRLARPKLVMRIGPWRYAVRLRQDLRRDDGKPAAGLCSYTQATIWLDDEVEGAQRLHVLLHEVYHAWLYHTARPLDAESACDLFATAAAQAMEDLAEQGGAEVLSRL